MTLFYGALFTIGMGLVLVGSRVAIEQYAERIIDRELTAASRVFQRFAVMRYDQMQQAAQVLAADFGFREAVATHDAPTIRSALDNLKARLGISHAFFVDLDGHVIGLDKGTDVADSRTLWQAVDNGATHGILHLGRQNYRASAAPVRIPNLVGWVVFANRLDGREMASLAGLSALPMQARIISESQLERGIAVAQAGSVPATEKNVKGERLLFQASPIENFGPDGHQVLVLEYSLTQALNEYAPMYWMLFACGIAGVGVTVAGSWYLARRLASPIEALDLAVQRVSSGEYVQVLSQTDDEIGRLANSFNAMVNDIVDRENQIKQAQAAANAELERTVREVRAENNRLNVIAQQQRSAVMNEAAIGLESELAPLLVVFDEEAGRLGNAARDMQLSLLEAKSRASEAARSARSTEHLTDEITHSAQELVVSGKDIASEAEASFVVVNRATDGSTTATRSFADLRLAVNEIGSVTDEIRAISHQTNMLALNASIEAARAGEMGLSFSAVATEVKNLAKQTAFLTETIGDRLAQVEQAMQDADTAILQVNQALVVAGEASSAIASSANQQSNATSTISGGISDIARDSRSVVRAVAQVDTAALESKHVADQVQSSAHAVALRAAALRETLDIFLARLRTSA